MIETIRAGTPLEQADKLIRDKHYTADRLKIERLSGKLLPIDQCYINLALTKKFGEEARLPGNNGASTTSPFSLLARQKVDASDESMQVDLAAIFNERKENEDAPIHPRRILIRGRAGVGKSTLCKKMVYDFTRGIETKLHRSWKKLFDRVLWIPLRRLKIQPVEGWSLESLFYHEYFKKGGEDKGHRLAKALNQALLSTSTDRTLFILDGLDEVSGSWGINDHRTEVLLELLNQPAVIITSRPSAILPAGVHKTDLELETIGFYPDQVKDYIAKTFTEREKVDKIQSFLQERWLIQGLVRIPIQLDALCYTWDDLEPGDIPNTMTGIYEEIELKLWKKDVVRLEKRHDDKMLTVGDLQTVDRSNIERFAKDEIYFLESLAFTGLRNDVIDFTSKHLKDISNHFTPDLLPDKTLPSLSFLRTSDPSSVYHNRNYHFIHLTFQEYFAAQYFARQWKDPEGQLQFLALGTNNAGTRSRPIEFLQKQKYTARYDIFWRFIAGLLNATGQSLEFISTIEEEPLDLLGPTHQRLVIHCLSETSGELPLRKTIEQRLAQWLLFECKFNESATLASELEFPEDALQTVLFDKSHNAQATILQTVAARASVSQSIAKAVAAHISDKDPSVRKAAIKAFERHATLPHEVLKAVAAHLGDEDKDVQSAASSTLNLTCAALPDEVIKAIAVRLSDKDYYTQRAAIEALTRPTALTRELLWAVASRLSYKDHYRAINVFIKREALPTEVLTALLDWLCDSDNKWSRALDSHRRIPDKVLEAVATRLGDENSNVRAVVSRMLRKRAALPNNVIRTITARLNDGNPDVRQQAIETLSVRVALPDETIKAIAAQLSDHNLGVRQAAIKALGPRVALPDLPDLPDEVLRAVVAQFSDEDPSVRLATTRAFSTGKALLLPDEVIGALAARLSDENLGVQESAIEALSTRAALPDNVIRTIAARLDDENPDVRQQAIKALGERVALPNKVVKAIAALLSDENLGVRMAATVAFYTRVALPYEVIMAIAERLRDKNSAIRSAAVRVFQTRRELPLPDKVIRDIATLLNDDGQRFEAMVALSEVAVLPDDALKAIAVWLRHEELSFRRIAIRIFYGYTKLPDEVLGDIAERLSDENVSVQESAIEALSTRAALPDRMLKAVEARLSDEHPDVRTAAIEALGTRAALPDGMLEAVAARLNDENFSVRQAASKALIHKQETSPPHPLHAASCHSFI